MWAWLCKSEPDWERGPAPPTCVTRQSPPAAAQCSASLGPRGSHEGAESASHTSTVRLDMPPQMDYFYHESRVPSACGLTREDELEPDVISCMLVGDGAVGKTSMIVSYTSNGYPAEYQQTGFDVFSGE